MSNIEQDMFTVGFLLGILQEKIELQKRSQKKSDKQKLKVMDLQELMQKIIQLLNQEQYDSTKLEMKEFLDQNIESYGLLFEKEEQYQTGGLMKVVKSKLNNSRNSRKALSEEDFTELMIKMSVWLDRFTRN